MISYNFFLTALIVFIVFKIIRQPTVVLVVRGNKIKQGGFMVLKVNDNLPVALLLEDKFGNVISGGFDAVPAWALTDPTMGAVEAATDGMSALVKPAGKLGKTQLQLTGMVEGKPMIGTLDLEMVPGDIAMVVLQPGAPVEQVEAPAPVEPAPAPVEEPAPVPAT